MRHISWFSCGAASAVATKIALQPDTVIARIVIDNEHPDNERFTEECERWYDRPILRLRSTEYRDVDDVIEQTRFLASPHGARCSTELKKRVRESFQRFGDIQSFGYTWEEQGRAVRFREHNPEIDVRFPLIEAQFSKDDCFGFLHRSGIALPVMYDLGFRNNNCIGCVKANSLKYWARIKEHFPDVYARRAAPERRVGATINRDRKTGGRLYLDELGPRLERLPADEPDVSVSCGILCEIAYQEAIDQPASLGTCSRCGASLNNVSPGFSIIAGGALVCANCLRPGEEIARARSL